MCLTTPDPAIDTVGGVRLDRAWWAPGLALHERIGPGAPAAGDAPDVDGPLADRVADLDLDSPTLRGLRTESRESLAARVPCPGWATTTERAVHTARPVSDPAEVSGSWRAAFGRIVAPFADDAVDRVAIDTTDSAGRAQLQMPEMLRGIHATLTARLVDIAARALVTELHHWRTAGRLTAPDSRQRFVEFATAMADPTGLVELVARYPVLARLLAQAGAAAASSTVELVRRLADDHEVIVKVLLGGVDPGPVTTIHTGRGDPHAGGRSVTFVDFARGARVVYKPRNVESQACVAGFVDWLTLRQPGLSPRVATTITRPGYGWSEYVSKQDLSHRDDADRFYRRQGALLAMLHVLRATDMHCENVVAHGDAPVLIDTETVFNAELRWPDAGDPALNRLNSSVYRTALLPLMVVGEHGVADLSGVGGGDQAHPTAVVGWVDAGTDQMRLVRRGASVPATPNRPRIAGVDLDPGDHRTAVVAGFRHTYDTIAAHRNELAAHLAEWAELDCRVIVRPTWQYIRLLDETTHPDVLRDAVDRDDALSVLYADRTAIPLLAQLVGHEIAAMWRGDVPMFLTRAGSGELRASDGTRFPVSLPRSGLDAALHTAAGLNEVDRREQEWIISALLATRSRTSAHPSGPVTGRTPTSSVVHPDRLIAAACAVADRIVAKAANGEDGDERVNWLGLEAVDDRQWLVLPLGASLGNGYLGVAVFLAQLTAVTGIDRYAEHAHRAVTDAAAVVDTFAERPERVLDAGWGGLAGLGGLTYGFARLSALLDDRNLAEAADRLVVLADGSVDNLSTLDWTGGLAGCLTAMSSVHLDLGLGSAAQVAGRCADRLARLAADVEGGSTSFADGLAGIGWALTRHGPHEVHRAAGRRLAALAVRDASAGGGWCHGSPGLALARSCLPAAAGPDATVLADVPLRDSLCLCHGELGVADVLRTLADADEHRDAAGPALRRRAGRILEVLRRNGPVCGVPGSVATPGLLNGLAGIGYGLLRLAVPEQVPSVLLLEPAATAPASTRPELDGGEL